MSQQVSVNVVKNVVERAPAEALAGRSLPRLFVATMRPHQWVKNLFILAPLLFSKKLGDPAAMSHALLAFASFCLMCSAIYIVNDVIDAPEDRAHPEKRLRPVASGALSVPTALVGAAALLALAFWIAATTLNLSFFLLAAVYCGLTLCYCLVLKRVMILDCMTIAAGFVLRVVSGAAAVEAEPTHWLIGCAFLLALLLAFTKRRQELLTLTAAAAHRRVLSDYTVSYLEQVTNVLIGATIVCYALYTVAPETVARFGTDKLIYGTAFVIYGLLRYLALVRNPATGGNPSKVLVSDRPLLITVLSWAAYNALVIYYPTLATLWERLR